MGRARYLRSNLITCGDLLSASSLEAGTATKMQKTGSGSGAVATVGAYTGAGSLDYKVEVQTSGARDTATFRWSDDGGNTWDASNVFTSSGDVALNNGLSVRFSTTTAATGYAAGDYWLFKAYRLYGPDKALDLNANTDLRAGAVTTEWVLTIPFSTAQAPDALVLYDHNMTSNATILLQAASSSGFPSTPISEAVNWLSCSLRHYVTTGAHSYGFWRVKITDTGNSAKLRVAEVYLGSYDDPGRNYALGSVRPVRRMAQQERMANGLWTGALQAEAREFSLTYSRMSESERDSVIAVFQGLNDVTNQRAKPVFFDLDSTSTGRTVYLCHWDGDAAAQHQADSPNLWTLPLTLAQIPRTA